jgi:CubicO group peptidase (beta-lactamase class C family)
MVGAAKLHGASLRETTPVYSLLAHDRSIAAKEPRKQRITLAHLLTHSSGLACDDGDKDSPGNEGTLQSQPDWNRYMLELPVVHEPGSKYAYCSGGLHLAGAMLRRATGLWLPELFDRYLARVMGIERYAINLAPNGDMYAGGGVQMRPRDLLKFGQLYLDGGTWNGRRLVDADWVKRSTQHQIRTNNNGSDGYAWHRNVLRANGREYQEYEANGNGGQFLIVIPELELAVVFTAGNYVQYLIWRRLRDEIVPQYVMSAIAR